MPGDSWSDPIILTPANSASGIVVPAGAERYYRMDLSTLQPRRLWNVKSSVEAGLDYWQVFYQLTPYMANSSTSWWPGNGNFYHIGNYRIPVTDYMYFYMVNGDSVDHTWGWTSSDPPPARPYTYPEAEELDLSVSGSIPWDSVPGFSTDQPSPGNRIYYFTAAASGFITLDAGDPSMYIDVYHDTGTGGYPNADYEAGEYETVGINVVEGEKYWIELETTYVDNPGTATGTFSWTLDDPVDPPPYTVSNDSYLTPITLNVATAGSITYDNTGATTDASPNPFWNDGSAYKRSIWYRLAPPTTNVVVKFTFTPSDPDPSYAPQSATFLYDTPTAAWNWTAYKEIVVPAGAESRLVMYFPDGNQGLWDNAGTLSWTVSPAPTNLTAPTATQLTQTSEVYLPSYERGMTTWVKVTQPVDGAFMMVLGDGTDSLELGSSIGGTVYRAEDVATTDYPPTEKILGYANWSDSEVAGTNKFVINGSAGDEYYVRVNSWNWQKNSLPIRIGMSSEVTYGDWQSSDYILEGQEESDPRRLPFMNIPLDDMTYIGTYPDGHYTITGAAWYAEAGQTTNYHETPWGGDFDELRAYAEDGQNRDKDTGEFTTAVPAFYEVAATGTPAPYYKGYNLIGAYPSKAINTVGMCVSAVARTMAFSGVYPGTKDYLDITSYEDWRWWVDRWALFMNASRYGLPTTPSAFRQKLLGMDIEWLTADGEEPGAQAWETTSQIGYSWTRRSTTPWIGGVPYYQPDQFDIELREGPFFDSPEDLDNWVTGGELLDMPIIRSFTAESTTASGTGGGAETSDYHFDIIPLRKAVEFDWEAAYNASEAEPYVLWQRAYYQTLSFYTRPTDDPIDIQGIIDGMAANNGGGGIPSWPFWEFSGSISYTPSISFRFPSQFRLGTYTENWTMPPPTDGGGGDGGSYPGYTYPDPGYPPYTDYFPGYDPDGPTDPINDGGDMWIDLENPPNYTYLSFDLSTNTQLGEIPFENVSYSHKLSAAGSASFSLPVTPDLLRQQIKDSTTPGRTGIYILRDDQIVWGGIIWKRMYDSNNRQVRFEAGTFESYFNHRIQNTVLGFEDVDQLTIARTLALQAADEIHVDVDETLSGVNRYYNSFYYDFKTLGGEIDSLASLWNGFDWNIRCYIDEFGVVRRRLIWGYPYLGVSEADTDMIFEYPGNIRSYTTMEDADKAGNRVWAVGGGQGLDQIQFEARSDFQLDNGWPLLETTTSYKDVFIPSQLEERSRVDLQRLMPPVTVLNVEVDAFSDPRVGSFNAGDWARFVIEDSWNNPGIDVKRRITGFTVSVQANSPLDRVTLEVDAGGDV